jgi:hypothetical protein
LVGLDAAFCVFGTSESGVNRRFRVNAITDAIITNQKDLDGLLKTYEERGIHLMTREKFLRS